MENKPDTLKDSKARHFITAALVIVSLGLIVYGLYTGEAKEVFQKAVNICLECIGVG